MDELQFYAEVEVTEWGEEPRIEIIGPFSADSPEELEDNLRRRGDDVLRVYLPEDF